MNNKDLNIIKQFESADKEEFKRPNHNDFLTSAELKAAQFSGVRLNSITNEQELWVLGEIKVSLPINDLRFQERWDKAYAEVFQLKEVQTINMKGN